MITKAFSREQWAKAIRQATRELNIPPRGPRGSKENKERQRLSVEVTKRARFLLMNKLVEG